MTEGAWTVQVTTQYSSGGRLVTTPRTTVMDAPLIIGEVSEGGGGSGSGEGGLEEDPLG